MPRNPSPADPQVARAPSPAPASPALRAPSRNAGVSSGVAVGRRPSTPLARLYANFGHPRGLPGAFAGHVMAWENRGVNALVVDLLTVEPADAVLDVGCGPGVAVALAARRATHGVVVGADPSPVMLAQARRRNRAAIAAGRVDVVSAAAEQLPFADGRFTAAFSVNAIAQWADPATGIAELHRVLGPGARLLLAFRAQRDSSATDPHAHGAGAEQITELTDLLRAAGFATVTRRDHARAREHLVTLLAGKHPLR
jgi:ubiquinone/menaquinone biosynthesis C-methylase UbiE